MNTVTYTATGVWARMGKIEPHSVRPEEQHTHTHTHTHTQKHERDVGIIGGKIYDLALKARLQHQPTVRIAVFRELRRQSHDAKVIEKGKRRRREGEGEEKSGRRERGGREGS